MKQWQFNLTVVGGVLVVALFITALVFGLNPLTFLFNFLVYILAVPGLLVVLPFIVGWFIPKGIQTLDDKAEDREDLPYGWHFLISPLAGLILGLISMRWIVPLVCQLSSVNQWVWEFLRFPKEYTGMPWGWFAVVASLLICGYVGYFIHKDFSS